MIGKEYMSRSGYFKKNLNGKLSFQSFVPTKLGDIVIDYSEELVNRLILVANKIGYLNGCFSMLTKEEQRTIIDDCLMEEIKSSLDLAIYDANFQNNFIPFGLDDEVKYRETNNREHIEFINLTDAYRFAIDRRKEIPICGRYFQEIHQIVRSDPKYEDKSPGWFRTSPNWIGTKEANLNTAYFVPPVNDDMVEAITDLEKYIHSENNQNRLIKAALIHYQFEVIHPFLDANGRIGRILNLIYLLEFHCIDAPIISLSSELNIGRNTYYQMIKNVEEYGNYEEWIQLYLKCMNSAIQQTIDKCMSLYEARK